MRAAMFAGTFYPKGERPLRAAIAAAFEEGRGPGSPPPRKATRNVVGAIVPHAGYAYSGACAAWAYHAIASSPVADLVILLGPSHHGGGSAATLETWKTPLGLVRADQEFVRGLVAKGRITLDDAAFDGEHSLEVQLPFLQSIIPEERLKICPLLIGEEADLKALALDLKETLVEQGKRAVIIASSDFTHHGPAYRHVRFTEETAKQIYEFDAQMLDLIVNRRADDFLAFVDRELATVCGAPAIALLLLLVKGRGKVEQYYTSGDVTGEYKNSVSYAAIIFEEA